MVEDELQCVQKQTNGEENIVYINDNLKELEFEDSIGFEFPYEVRDSFLINFLKGQEYITYYYIIGQVAYENNAINLLNVMDHYNFVIKVQNAANLLMYGSATSIPFPTSFKNDALAMIIYYRTVDTSTEFNDILDIIEQDLIDCENLTKSQIYALY